MKLKDNTNYSYIVKILDELCCDFNVLTPMEKEFTIYEMNQCPLGNIFADNTPFSKSFNFIGVDSELCDEIHLTDKERQSLFLHEIGHIARDITQGEMDDKTFYVQREICADSFAVDYGFCEELVSALDKLLLIKELTQEQEDGIKERISHWKNILKTQENHL